MRLADKVREERIKSIKTRKLAQLADTHDKQQEIRKQQEAQVNGNYFMLNDKLETYEDILSKLVESDQIEKE